MCVDCHWIGYQAQTGSGSLVDRKHHEHLRPLNTHVANDYSMRSCMCASAVRAIFGLYR